MKFIQLKSRQSGAVMVTVLVMLVIITLMGLSAMKQGLYQGSVGSAEVAYATCFSGAESGLNAVYREFQSQSAAGQKIDTEDTTNFMAAASTSRQAHCLSDAGISLRSGEACPNGNMTEYVEVSVLMISRPPNDDEASRSPTMGTDLDKGAGTFLYSDARCEVEGMDLAVMNTQGWKYTPKTSVFTDGYTGF